MWGIKTRTTATKVPSLLFRNESNENVSSYIYPPQRTIRCIQEPIRSHLGPNGSYIKGRARDLDTKNKKILCDTGSGEIFELHYDKLVIAVGVKTNTFGIESIREGEKKGDGIFFLKHLAHARAIRDNIIDSFEKASLPTVSDAEKRRLLSFIAVGGGPTSCEFTAELHGKWAVMELNM